MTKTMTSISTFYTCATNSISKGVLGGDYAMKEWNYKGTNPNISSSL